MLSACGGDLTIPGADRQDITVANLNILHGIFCKGPTEGCRREERVELLFDWIAAASCPDIVALQETTEAAAKLIAPLLGQRCPFIYQAAPADDSLGIDSEYVLSRYPILSTTSQVLFGGFRHALVVRIDHPVGPVDIFVTHLASGSDGAEKPCGDDCPPACVVSGAQTVRECQAVQLAELVNKRASQQTPAIVTGDFNSVPGSFEYNQFVHRGWPDAYLAAGAPECDPTSGIGCTAGRDDASLKDLESPELNMNERIDFIFVAPAGPGATCRGTIDSANDADADASTTGGFADLPNPFVTDCGGKPLGVCWPSDHSGVRLDLNCQ